MRPLVSKPRAEREAEILAHVTAGAQLPSAIAKAMGCSKELVMLYARQMSTIVIRRERHQGERMQNVLALALTQAPAA